MNSTNRRLAHPLSVAAFGVLPPFLAGASSPQIGAALGIGSWHIGIAAASAFGTAAIVSRAAGRWVQRHGARGALALAAALSSLSLVGISLAISFPLLVLSLCTSGIGNAIAQPGANLAISQLVPQRRLGLAIGVKQSSIPLATLMCGLVVPIVVLPIGWRATFGLFALLTLIVSILSIVLRSDAPRPHAGGVPVRSDTAQAGRQRRALVLLAAGACVGTAASSSLGVFFVGAGTASGLSSAHASLLLAACSVTGLSTRIALGWAADSFRRFNSFAAMAVLLTAGAAGYLLLAQDMAFAFVVGGFLAYGAGWTWAGLAHLTAIRQSPDGAATATGVLQIGISFGGAIGPVFLGYLVDSFSYSTAWLVASLASLLAAAVVVLASKIGRAASTDGD